MYEKHESIPRDTILMCLPLFFALLITSRFFLLRFLLTLGSRSGTPSPSPYLQLGGPVVLLWSTFYAVHDCSHGPSPSAPRCTPAQRASDPRRPRDLRGLGGQSSLQIHAILRALRKRHTLDWRLGRRRSIPLSYDVAINVALKCPIAACQKHTVADSTDIVDCGLWIY